MVLTIVIYTVFNSNKNCDCSKLYYTKVTEESSVQRVKRVQSYITSNIRILFAVVLWSAYRIQQLINLSPPPPPPKKTQHTETEHRAVVSNDDL